MVFGCIFFLEREREIYFSIEKKRVADNLRSAEDLERRRLVAINSRAIEEKCSVGRNILTFFSHFCCVFGGRLYSLLCFYFLLPDKEIQSLGFACFKGYS